MSDNKATVPLLSGNNITLFDVNVFVLMLLLYPAYLKIILSLSLIMILLPLLIFPFTNTCCKVFPVVNPVTLNVPPVLFVKIAVPFEYVPPVTKVSCVEIPVKLDPSPYKVPPLIVVADIVPFTVNPLTESI